MTKLNRFSQHNADRWTTAQLVDLSQNMAIAFNSGFERSGMHAQHDGWTAEKLAQFGMAMSTGFHPGL